MDALPVQPARSIVKLNIGGVLLCTTAGTLLSHGENFFTGLLSGRFPVTLDDSGAYFVDRNGRAFEPLLDYLRSGVLIIPPQVSLDAVLLEASFFCIDISLALSGMLKAGLYTGRNAGNSDVVILFVEKDPTSPAIVAVTGVIDGFLVFEHVCHIEQGKIVLRVPSNEYHLQPAGKEFSFEYPIDEEESDFNRGFLSFIDTQEEMLAKVLMGTNGIASIFSVQVLCANVVTLSTATKPYGLVYLSGKVPFFFTTGRGSVKACVLKRLP